MTINVSNHMARKSIVRDLSGQIINLLDETDGGWIIRNRQIVNQEKWERIQKEEEDRKIAAQAILNQRNDENIPDRTLVPGKIEALEQRINEQDKKLDAILEALTKK